MSFYNTIKDDINIILKQDLLKKNYKKEIYDMFQVSDPPKDKFGDVSTNAALSLSKFLKTNPENFADILIKELKKIDYIEDIKVEGHGFINLLLKKDFWINELKQVLLKEDKYGESNIGKSKKVIIEFVSANPTGPLHIGHCRGAVYGDVLCNIMKKLGYKVYKEFYINNTGSQIDKLTNSVIYRYNELFNKNKKKIDDNLYPGEYLIALAKDIKKNYGSKLLENNKKFNLISKSTENILKTRHILDSAQVIDFIDKNSKICADLGTGAGFPGIVLSILFRERKYPIRIDLYEKSPKKCQFLSKVVKKLNLNALVLEKNVFEQKNLEVDTIVARAFKPIQSIFKIVTENFKNYKNLIFFLGKNSKQTLLDASKVWEFEYKERKSVTSDDSLILNIKKIRKKI